MQNVIKDKSCLPKLLMVVGIVFFWILFLSQLFSHRVHWSEAFKPPAIITIVGLVPCHLYLCYL
jgi:magnesium-transporting ATPase (P-type)